MIGTVAFYSPQVILQYLTVQPQYRQIRCTLPFEGLFCLQMGQAHGSLESSVGVAMTIGAGMHKEEAV